MALHRRLLFGVAAWFGAALVTSCSGGGGGVSAPGPTGSQPSPSPAPSASPVLSGPYFTVNAAAGRHPISPDIYGISFFYSGPSAAGQYAFARTIGLTVDRIGGDATTRYNWQVDSSNAGRDWYFAAGNGQSVPTASGSIDNIVTQNHAIGAKTIVTIPMIQYINNASAWHCSFPQSVYGAQMSYDPYLHPNGDNCGNGVRTDGSLIPQESPIVTDMLNSPATQSAWVSHLVGRFGPASRGGVPIYELDNEPSGWQAIHRDVHPAVTTCQELLTQSLAYGAAIKSADSSAAVLGPDDIPAADVLSCNGITGRGLWYLQQMAAYQQQHGVRLLDYFALHYPGWGSGDPIVNAAARIKLHQSWVASAYPGTKLAYDEYNWGDPTLANSALLTADGLGLFGQQGVDLASFFGISNPSAAPATFGFLMFRNYDGNNGRFGDVSVQVGGSNANGVEVYAAQRTSDQAVTVLVINRQSHSNAVTFALSGHSANGPVRVYRFVQNGSAITRQADATMTAGVLPYSYPAQSMTLFVVP